MSRPAFLINTEELTEKISARLTFLRVMDDANFKNDRFEMQMDNREPWIEPPEEGTDFEVSMGYDSDLRVMGTYQMDEVIMWGPPHTITIIGHCVNTASAFKASKSVSWHGKSLSDIVQSIGSGNGLGVKIDPSLGSIAIPHIEQSAQSDMGFLTDLARSNNAIMKVMNGSIYFAKQDQTKAQDGSDISAANIQFNEVTKYNYVSQGRGKYSGVKGRYYDKATGKEMVATAGDGEKAAHTLGEIHPDKLAAQNSADSTFAQMNRTRETLELTLPGNPLIMSEVPVSLAGFPPHIPTDWTVDKAEHMMTGKGAYTTMCVLVVPGSSAQSGGGGGGQTEEKSDNKDGGNDGHTVTESVNPNEVSST
jgi:phage protein D